MTEKTSNRSVIKNRVNEGVNAQSFMKQREATKQAKKAFKGSKKVLKLEKSGLKNAKIARPSTDEFSKKPILKAKDKVKKAKIDRKVHKKVYKIAKKRDTTRISNQLKRESKLRVKQDMIYKAQQSVEGDDILESAADTYKKAQKTRYNMKTGLKVSKSTGKLGVKTVKGSYGLGNRFFNYTTGRGFNRTPKDLTLRSKSMKKMRLVRQRFKYAAQMKKAQTSAQLFKALFTGKQAVAKVATAVVSNPFTWIFVSMFFFFFFIVATVSGTAKPAIVQDEKDLTESWVYTTGIDAKNTKDSNSFYSNIDEIMFYMNTKHEDYKLKDYTAFPNTYEDYLDTLWVDLNGKSPDYDLKEMSDLIKDKKTKYYLKKDDYDEYSEMKDELGYSTLSNRLGYPTKSKKITISRRYGYEIVDGKKKMNKGIDIDVVENAEILSPLSGKITKIPDESSLEITSNDTAKLLIQGVDSSRFKGGETVKLSEFIGLAKGSTLTFTYDKKEDDEWVSVNPAFYFPKATYSQNTVLAIDYGSESLSPEVTKLIPKFKAAMKEVGMPEKFLAVVLAVCMQESGGRLADVMQASESLGLPPNTLDTDASIKQGVKYLWSNMKLVGLDLVNQDEVYVKTAVQAYNFGVGFIPFTKSKGYAYSEELASAFAMEMSGGAGGYGDPKYVPHVWRYIDGGGSASNSGKFAYPLPKKINDVSGFDYRYNPITGAYELHLGLDFPVASGTPVYASEDATVMRNSDVGDTYGTNIVLKHSKGKYWTRYAHLSKAAVSVGQKVKRGQLIGYVGTTGMSTGPHLHYEVMTSMYGGHVDPRNFI